MLSSRLFVSCVFIASIAAVCDLEYVQFHDGTKINPANSDESCVLDSCVGSVPYWVKYQCHSAGFLEKYVYAANDQCDGDVTDVTSYININPKVVADWCCTFATANGALLPVPPVFLQTTTTTTTPPELPLQGSTPTLSPTFHPTSSPSSSPTANPTGTPTAAPTAAPTYAPTMAPTIAPTESPTRSPIVSPTLYPTMSPTTWSPTRVCETRPPTPSPTSAPTAAPTESPTDAPSLSPTGNPTVPPTIEPSQLPTIEPTIEPTMGPTVNPTSTPTSMPLPFVNYGESEDDNPDGSFDENIRNANGAGHNHNPIRAQAIPSIPVHAICLLGVVAIFVAAIYNFIKKSKTAKKDIRWSLKIPVMICFAAHIVGVAFLTSLSTLMITAERWDVATYERALVQYTIVSISYIVGKMGLETFFILRAYQGFQKSAFALSKFTLFVLLISMLIIAAFGVFVLLDREFRFHYVSNLILSVLDGVFMACLLVLFTKKLNGLVMLHRSQCMAEISSMIDQDTTTVSNERANAQHAQDSHDQVKVKDNSRLEIPSEFEASTAAARSSTTQITSNAIDVSTVVRAVKNNLTSSQTRWISVITRCIILSCIAFSTTIMFGFLSFFYLRQDAPLYVLYASWSLDMLINSVCLYLNFAFSSTLYNWCCGCCHRGCQNGMQYCAARQIVREHAHAASLEHGN